MQSFCDDRCEGRARAPRRRRNPPTPVRVSRLRLRLATNCSQTHLRSRQRLSGAFQQQQPDNSALISMSFFASCSFANLSFSSCSHLACRSSPRRSSRRRRRSRPSLQSTCALPRRSSRTSRTSSTPSAEILFFKADCNPSKKCKIIVQLASIHKKLK